ncbi:null pigmentation [Fusarium albosuccineum]|uniref:holo-[acyl-carrier-protein] synthase n=1 Tax=Fusarium albosuccineum TaxID=1237068 RepID=A0A8H4KAX8_9HYPO|nr:null pigmentation [Fusarium albosuccineum]
MSESPTVIQWAIDTRPLWPSALNTKDLTTVASRALSLLSSEQQASVLRYYHVRDAKLALASALIKRYAISRFCRVPWAAAETTRDARTKPVFRLPNGDEPLLFNVSHQAGLAVLFAVHNPPKGLAVGVDIVCPSERRARDLDALTKEGWPSFVDMHAEVFGTGEVTALKRMNPGAVVSDRDRALRSFYALWCLREAYVKMTGEALLASWLGDLEMRGFAPPEDMHRAQEVWFRGDKVQDVDIQLVPLLDEFMVSTAVRNGDNGEGIQVGEFQALDMDQILAFGEQQKAS